MREASSTDTLGEKAVQELEDDRTLQCVEDKNTISNFLRDFRVVCVPESNKR